MSHVIARARVGHEGISFGSLVLLDPDDSRLDTELFERINPDALTRAELDDLARVAGISPDELASKAAVVDELEDALPTADEVQPAAAAKKAKTAGDR